MSTTGGGPSPGFRAGVPAAHTRAALGPIQELPGTWIGSGVNLITRPDHQGGKPFFLQLNATGEGVSFMEIGAPIPNRGSVQDDIVSLGVHYLQQVSDAVTKGALHLEPGICLRIPPTTDPAAPETAVRLATIPHGDALLAQGQAFTVPGGPTIAPVSSTPIDHATGRLVTGATYLAPFTSPAAGHPGRLGGRPEHRPPS